MGFGRRTQLPLNSPCSAVRQCTWVEHEGLRPQEKNGSVPLSHEPVALGWDLRHEGSARKGVIRQEAERGYPVTAVSNTPYNARLGPKGCRRWFSYTFLEVRRESREGNKTTPPQETRRRG